jgi:hypothetical protein
MWLLFLLMREYPVIHRWVTVGSREIATTVSVPIFLILISLASSQACDLIEPGIELNAGDNRLSNGLVLSRLIQVIWRVSTGVSFD